MRNCYDSRFLHRWMGYDRILQINRTDPFTPGLNKVLLSIGDLDVTLVIDCDHISSSEPTIVCPARIFFEQVVIAPCNPWPANLQLSHRAPVPGNFSLVVACT